MTAGNRLWGGRTLHEVFGAATRGPLRRPGIVRDAVAAVLMVAGIVCVLVGAWVMWGWPAALFTIGLGCLIIGVVLGIDVIGE